MATWINASEPSVVPPVPEKVFDKWRIEQFSTVGEGTATPTQLHVIFVKARTWDEQVTNPETNEVTTVTKTEINPAVKTNLFVPDLYELMTTDADVMEAFNKVLSALAKVAAQKGVI